MTLIEPNLFQRISVLNGEDEAQLLDTLRALPVAAYATDAEGYITFFNEAAAALWGCRPALGQDRWCGSWRLFKADGTPQSHDQSALALTIKQKRPVTGMASIAERPDGSRVSFLPFPSPWLDANGKVVGAINMLVDITARTASDENSQRLAAIVESSDDAIVGKDLRGIITSWNRGAERIFGYLAEEAIGKSITMLIPADRQDEEVQIIDRIRRGQRVEHFETIRRRKHGSLVDISLTVSPVRDATGKIVGASKVARDITGRKRAEQKAREHEQRLSAELADMRRLQDISTRLIQQDHSSLYDAILDAALTLTRSDMATMQMFDSTKEGLRLLGARGFDATSIKSFEWVARDAGTSCAAALRAGHRVIISDIETSDLVVGTPAQDDLRNCGIRAAQSTPLTSRSGVLIGMITNHWREPHEPGERELLLIDVLARQAADLIERKNNEERIVILAREAEHRAKNILANVSATVRLTNSDTVAGLKEAINGRIQALANVHRLFAQSNWTPVDLWNVVTQELSPYSQGNQTRTRIDGPHIMLEPNTIQAVAMVLHELATNAAKYGALSVPKGHVDVRWSRAADGAVAIHWSETGGPPVKQPERRGFGTRVMDNMIKTQLNGAMRFDWRPDGLVCDITLPA